MTKSIYKDAIIYLKPKVLVTTPLYENTNSQGWINFILKIQVFNRKLKYYKNNNAIGFNTKI